MLSRSACRPALQAVADLIRPEALQAHQGAIEPANIIMGDFTDRLDRAELALIEMMHDLAGCLALLGQADAHRAAVGLGALVMDIAHVDQLLEIV